MLARMHRFRVKATSNQQAPVRIEIANQSIKTRNYKVKRSAVSRNSWKSISDEWAFESLEEQKKFNNDGLSNRSTPHFFGCHEQRSDNKSLNSSSWKIIVNEEALLTWDWVGVVHELCLTFINRRRKLHENFVIVLRFRVHALRFWFSLRNFFPPLHSIVIINV